MAEINNKLLYDSLVKMQQLEVDGSKEIAKPMDDNNKLLADEINYIQDTVVTDIVGNEGEIEVEKEIIQEEGKFGIRYKIKLAEELKPDLEDLLDKQESYLRGIKTQIPSGRYLLPFVINPQQNDEDTSLRLTYFKGISQITIEVDGVKLERGVSYIEDSSVQVKTPTQYIEFLETIPISSNIDFTVSKEVEVEGLQGSIVKLGADFLALNEDVDEYKKEVEDLDILVNSFDLRIINVEYKSTINEADIVNIKDNLAILNPKVNDNTELILINRQKIIELQNLGKELTRAESFFYAEVADINDYIIGGVSEDTIKLTEIENNNTSLFNFIPSSGILNYNGINSLLFVVSFSTSFEKVATDGPATIDSWIMHGLQISENNGLFETVGRLDLSETVEPGGIYRDKISIEVTLNQGDRIRLYEILNTSLNITIGAKGINLSLTEVKQFNKTDFPITDFTAVVNNNTLETKMTDKEIK